MGNFMTPDLPFAEQVPGEQKNAHRKFTTPERTPGVEKVSFMFLYCWEIKVIGYRTFEPNKTTTQFFVKKVRWSGTFLKDYLSVFFTRNVTLLAKRALI